MLQWYDQSASSARRHVASRAMTWEVLEPRGADEDLLFRNQWQTRENLDEC